ncbi:MULTISPECIES: DUF4198 domain-containing protein [unclassified Sphingomonas]|uniref:DUF4198 domain-containing protein n=1 Tax=unclassified Sphingomonas TaxID=196159 RepID=UPI0006F250B6|nr:MULTISPECIES: DUF4198 domain-containing protein [unclassified Sphingomonas]KQM66759.1 nickel ABC transporter substrate-binding protein [Sphingomonas sp. Leaf16]KQN17707.1 nickel ABC transporter substrate-binding protein [Sphingomonas sp. Leaf29]KQN23570.1 nickel ABC transporter substrate-binding protein [Sphingomonas sp. Leaf32]
MARIHAIGSALVLGGAVLLPSVAADAHGIWFAQRAKQLAIIYGVGADDLEAVKRQPMLESIQAWDAALRPVAARLRTDGPVVVVDIDAKPALVSAVLPNGTWTKLPDGEFVKKGKDEVPGAKFAETTIKYAVTLQGAGVPRVPLIPAQLLQIVPVGAIPAKLGQPLTYRITFRGKPVAGAEVVNDMVNDPDATPRVTRTDGLVTLPVRNQGLNVIRAVLTRPSDRPAQFDRYEHTATLAFTLPHAPEE